jgi:carbon-monoxide dehydrogenase medium subunit
MMGRSLVIGATARHADVAVSAVVGVAIRTLAEMAGLIGDPAVRHKGTIGGSLANNDPTAIIPPRASRSAPPRHQQAPPQAGRILPGPVHDLAGERRNHHQGDVPGAEKGRYIKFRTRPPLMRWSGVFVAKRPSDVRVAVTGAGSNGGSASPRSRSPEEAASRRRRSMA